MGALRTLCIWNTGCPPSSYLYWQQQNALVPVSACHEDALNRSLSQMQAFSFLDLFVVSPNIPLHFLVIQIGKNGEYFIYFAAALSDCVSDEFLMKRARLPMNRPCISGSQVLSLWISLKFTFPCKPGSPPCANGKLMQQGAHIYLTVIVTVILHQHLSPGWPQKHYHTLPWTLLLYWGQCHSEPYTGTWKVSLDDWIALTFSWSEFSSWIWKLKVFQVTRF